MMATSVVTSLVTPTGPRQVVGTFPMEKSPSQLSTESEMRSQSISDSSKVPVTTKRVLMDKIKLAGDSIWWNRKDFDGREISEQAGKPYPKEAEVGDMEEEDNDLGLPSTIITVYHNLPWEIYTDTGFAEGVKRLWKERTGEDHDIDWTEQGMQNDSVATFDMLAKQ